MNVARKFLMPSIYLALGVLVFAGPAVASMMGEGASNQPTSSPTQEGSSVDPCSTVIGLLLETSPVVRARCEVNEVEDERVGTSYDASVFVGLCESRDDPDEECVVRAAEEVPRTGAEARDDLYTLDAEMNDPTTVCLQFVGCHTIHKPSGRFRATAFNNVGASEAEGWTPTGGNVALNPGEACARNGEYGDECTGETGDENLSISGSPTSWVVVNP